MGQLKFDFSVDLNSTYQALLNDATQDLAAQGSIAARGAVFTRVEVVDFLLDLAGYTVDQKLHRRRLLEPAFGSGEFLYQTIKRLLASWRRAESSRSAIEDLGEAICAIELHRDTFEATRADVITLLTSEGLTSKVSISLADRWLCQGDFLLTPLQGTFDFAIGNPPYVRQELIPTPLLTEYRRRYHTIYDRADLYIPFIERSLSLLSKGGCLGFICADRWMKNRYGGPLRKLVAEQFHLKIHVDMVDTPAFDSEVIAYPAITVISREDVIATRMAYRPDIDRATLEKLSKALRTEPLRKGNSVQESRYVVNGSEPWLLDSAANLSLVRRLETTFPTLAEAGCKVGIGVATGADKAFIGSFYDLDVEPDRKLPLATTKDVVTGEVVWQGKGIINPFAEQGGLVDLQAYPRLCRYLEGRREAIANRHCAKKNPANWYRTIDRITPKLLSTPKLLIPDIKGKAHVVFECGELYPHHNLYYITANEWDLRALQAVLLSAISYLFVSTYSTKMQGGFLRFQAQYLRRIRVPMWQDVSKSLRVRLAEAALCRDVEMCDRLVSELYGLSLTEQNILSESRK